MSRRTGRSSWSKMRRSRRWRRSRRGGSTSNCRTSGSKKCRPASTRRVARRTSVRLRRPGQRRAGGVRSGIEQGDIVGQQGIEKRLQRDPEGRGRRARRRRQQRGSRDQHAAGRDQPTEGKRLQLTIDYDVQRAAEEAFNAVSTRASTARALHSRSAHGRGAGVTRACRSTTRTTFAAGIDRGTWASLNTRRAAPAEQSRDSGAVLAGIDLQDRRSRWPASKRTSSIRTSTCTAAAGPTSSDAISSAGKGGHGSVDLRHAIEKSCNVYFYTARQHARRRRINKWASCSGLVGKTGIDLPNEVTGLVPIDQVEAGSPGERWYPAKRSPCRNRTGCGLGHAGVDGGVHGDDRQRRHARHTAPRQGDRRRHGSGWKPMPVAAVRSRSSTFKPEKLAAIRDGMWMVVNGSGTGGRARDSLGTTSPARPGRRRSSRTRAARAARGTTVTCATTAGSSFFAPRDNPEIAGIVFREHDDARVPTPRRSPITSSRRTSRSRKDVRCRCCRSRRRCGSTSPTPPATVVRASIPIRRRCLPMTVDRTNRARDRAAERSSRRSRSCSHGAGEVGMFERRLYYHVDWAMLGAVLALCLIGVVQIYSATGGVEPLRHADVRHRHRARRARRVPDHRLPFAGRQVALHLPGNHRASRVRALLRRRPRRLAALDRSGSAQPAAVGIRQGGGRARAGQVLRREPARRRRPE